MKKVLFVNGCIRGAQSRTLRLAQRLIRQIPDAEIEVLALPALHLRPYEAKDIAERDAFSAAGAFSLPFFALANQFKSADAIVLACPYWDLSVPSMVRNYLERVCVTGLTFHYNNQGYPVGDCRATRFVYVTTRGGLVNNDDPVLADHGSAYLHSICKLLTPAQFDVLAAEGLDIQGNDAEALLQQADQSIACQICLTSGKGPFTYQETKPPAQVAQGAKIFAFSAATSRSGGPPRSSFGSDPGRRRTGHWPGPHPD